MENLGAVRLLEADAGVETVLGGEQFRVRGGHEVVADDAVDVAHEIHPGVGVVRVGARGAGAPEAVADAAGAVDDHVLLDHRVTAALPEVDAVFGQTPVAPEAIDVVASHYPAPGLVHVDAAGVTVVANLSAAEVGELDSAALDGPVVDVAHTGRVDLDRLLAGVDDAQVVDQDAGDRGARTVDLDRVVVGIAQGEVGDGHVRGPDLDQEAGVISRAGGVATVDDHRSAVAARRAEADPGG